MGKRNNNIIGILIIVFAVLIAALLIGGSIYLVTAKNKVKSIQITPDFSETELGVGSEYTFTVSASPAKASLKKVECVADDANATFKISKDGKAVLTTGATEGTITLYLEYKDVKSNVLTFQVVDLIARAQAQAEAEAAAAAAAAAAEEEAQIADAMGVDLNAKKYVKMTGSDVNVRSQNNTDCEKLGKAQKGDIFEKVEDVDDWTHIIYNGQDGYIKSEFLVEITEEEAMGGASDTTEATTATTTTTTTNNEAEKKEDEDKNKGQYTEEQAAAAQQAAADAAKKAADELAAAQAAQELQAQQEAAAAAAAVATPTAGLTAITCKDGTCYVTAAQLEKIHATWDFAGDAIEMAGHHNIGELEAVIGATQH